MLFKKGVSESGCTWRHAGVAELDLMARGFVGACANRPGAALPSQDKPLKTHCSLVSELEPKMTNADESWSE